MESKEQQFTVTAIIASTGHALELTLSTSTSTPPTYLALKQRIAEDTSILVEHQVLFTPSGVKLKDTDSLSTSTSPLFVFDSHHGEHPSLRRRDVLRAADYALTPDCSMEPDAFEVWQRYT